MARKKKEPETEQKHPVFIDFGDSDGYRETFYFMAPDKGHPANALLTQAQIDLIEKAEELTTQAQEILETAYYGKTREERVLEEIKERARREQLLREKGEKLRL